MKKIALYSYEECPYCKQTKEYFAKHHIEYANYDVHKDEAKAQEMIDITGQMAVPVVRITNGEEQIIIGFDPRAYDKALAN